MWFTISILPDTTLVLEQRLGISGNVTENKFYASTQVRQGSSFLL